LIKTIYLKARGLEITASLYSPLKGLRAIYYIEKDSMSRVRGAGNGCQMLRRNVILLFQPYYLWEFEGFLYFVFFVVLLLCNSNKIL